MRIDGKAIADHILSELAARIATLREKNIIPTLAVILVGDDPGSLSYVKQKQKAAEKIGAKLVLHTQSAALSKNELQELIEKYNADPSIHGLIVQRPLPSGMGDCTDILNQIHPHKDVDGFVPKSPFAVPVAAAVLKILNEIFVRIATNPEPITNNFHTWLASKKIVILGRGETAGAPIAAALTKRGYAPMIIHSQTPNPDQIIRQAAIVVSCVGRAGVIKKDAVAPGAILISVGIWRGSDGKLHGDYEEDDVAGVASFYTPTPGGVGPVNVACLMQNLVKAATIV